MFVTRVVLAFLWMLLVASCREVSFPVPQPAGVEALQEVPASLRGRYLSYDQASGENADTLIIESWGYHLKDKEDNDWLNRGVLSDTLVLKFYDGHYFVNFKVEDQWVLRVVKQKPSGGIEFLSIDLQDEAKRKETLQKISKDLKIREIDINGDLFYQISPTREQLMALIREGLFTGVQLDKLR